MTDVFVCVLLVIRVIIVGLVEHRPLDPEVACSSLSVFYISLHLMFITFEEPADCLQEPCSAANQGFVGQG